MLTPPVTQGTILMVDDEEANLYALRLILESKGYRCLEASSGPEAIEAATESNTDVILLDVVMPGRNGYEVCQELKSDDRTRDIPVIFVTVKGTIEEVTGGLDIGAHDYIPNPNDLLIVMALSTPQNSPHALG